MTDQTDPARPAGRTVVCTAPARKPLARWTHKRRQHFLMVLTETANVSQSARDAGVSLAAAYNLKRRDPTFAAAWAEALEAGFCEAQFALLREIIHGRERVETMRVGEERTLKYEKTVRDRDIGVAVRVLAAHREEVAAFRLAREEAAGAPVTQSALERARAHLAEVRARLLASEQAGAGAGGDEADGAMPRIEAEGGGFGGDFAEDIDDTPGDDAADALAGKA
ncbi:MAG: hypothetical protein J0I80_13515 [Sphingomonas sp.]|nr:hypothetical protein [Sphingomonas sp.]